jgi:hypothetical protein
VHGLARLAATRRTALLCYEADPARCHRSYVAQAVARVTPLRIVDLRPAGSAP